MVSFCQFSALFTYLHMLHIPQFNSHLGEAGLFCYVLDFVGGLMQNSVYLDAITEHWFIQIIHILLQCRINFLGCCSDHISRQGNVMHPSVFTVSLEPTDFLHVYGSWPYPARDWQSRVGVRVSNDGNKVRLTSILDWGQSSCLERNPIIEMSWWKELVSSGVFYVCACVQMGKSGTNVQDLASLANNLTHCYSDLAAESCRIALACPSPQVNNTTTTHFTTIIQVNLC